MNELIRSKDAILILRERKKEKKKICDVRCEVPRDFSMYDKISSIERKSRARGGFNTSPVSSFLQSIHFLSVSSMRCSNKNLHTRKSGIFSYECTLFFLISGKGSIASRSRCPAIVVSDLSVYLEARQETAMEKRSTSTICLTPFPPTPPCFFFSLSLSLFQAKIRKQKVERGETATEGEKGKAFPSFVWKAWKLRTTSVRFDSSRSGSQRWYGLVPLPLTIGFSALLSSSYRFFLSAKISLRSRLWQEILPPFTSRSIPVFGFSWFVFSPYGLGVGVCAVSKYRACKKVR